MRYIQPKRKLSTVELIRELKRLEKAKQEAFDEVFKKEKEPSKTLFHFVRKKP